ncbi:cation:proton antiporter [Streptomyces sp. NPDC007095]|uniref:cation:proton antiporter n=1 Tax=Streptomyces sp. NPDC007095 TaxID=3154482 RepID=UPI0034095EBB
MTASEALGIAWVLVQAKEKGPPRRNVCKPCEYSHARCARRSRGGPPCRALCGRLAVLVRQPPVVGEMAAGIILGPSVLGRLPGDPHSRLFGPHVMPCLQILAQVGLALYLFGVGHELGRRSSLQGGRAVMGVVIGGFGLPMALGVAAGVAMHGEPSTVGGVPVVLYVGVAMAITALPVLARILTDHKISTTTAGTVALTAATAMDVLGWAVLALVVALARGATFVHGTTLVGWACCFLATAWLVPHLLRRMPGLAGRAGPVPVAALALAAAWTAERLGLHAAFGALLAGAVLPRRPTSPDKPAPASPFPPLAGAARLLLPVFFVVAGSSVDLGSLTGGALLLLALVLPLTVGGKILGGYLGARLGGLTPHDSLTVGILLNTRGLTELIVLSIGLTAGLLSQAMYTAFVAMALVTTAMTGPLLSGRALAPREVSHGTTPIPRDRGRA